MCLTFPDTSSMHYDFTRLGIGTLQIQGNTSLSSLSTHCQGGTSESSKEPLKDTMASLAGTPISSCDTGSVVRGTNGNVEASESEVQKAVREEDHDNMDLKEPHDKRLSLPSSEKPRVVSNLSQPKFPSPNILELSHLALAVEDSSPKGSFNSDTDSQSDGEWLDGRALGIALQISEQHDLGATFDSKWIANFTNHAGHQGSASTSTTASKSAKHSASTSSSSHHSHKHVLLNHGDYPADEDDDPPERPGLDLSNPEDLGNSVKLVCPFFKHDPRKYNPIDYHTCATTSWKFIKHLK
jgi:hypothetical protein